MECEKLAQEKTEMQRHYVMVSHQHFQQYSTIYSHKPLLTISSNLQYYEMSYGLNVEMHKQTEICKRLDAIIRQVLPFLSGEVSLIIIRYHPRLLLIPPRRDQYFARWGFDLHWIMAKSLQDWEES